MVALWLVVKVGHLSDWWWSWGTSVIGGEVSGASVIGGEVSGTSVIGGEVSGTSVIGGEVSDTSVNDGEGGAPLWLTVDDSEGAPEWWS